MAEQNAAMLRARKSPTPLLLPPKAMEMVLTKERMRCDRHGHFFSLIVLELNTNATRAQIRLLAKILHHRLRLTDEKGLLLKGGIGVLLPMTGLHGAKIVLNSIVHTASKNGIEFSSAVFTYSGRDDHFQSEDRDSDSIESDSEMVFESSTGTDDTIVENLGTRLQGSLATGSSSTASLPKQSVRAIRADAESQKRPASTDEVRATDSLASPHFSRRYPVWKRTMDIACASIGLVIAMPVIAISAIAIKLTSKGPIFFRQLRTGQYGNAFPVYKLRTMVVDAEELKEKLQWLNERDGPAFKIKNDPRVTPVGGILRKTGLDELPQLWNVLLGHMAIVGPRPLPCNEDARCKIWQRRRLDTKPGLTCTWQISKSRKISFSDWMRMDLRYSDKRTLVGDVSLMFKTVKAVFLGRVGH